MRIPLDPKLKKLTDVPYTISYVIRKRQQIDSFNELPKEKRPPDDLIWDGTSDELEEWIDKVFGRNKSAQQTNDKIIINIDDVEG